jgi:hypothetical protein
MRRILLAACLSTGLLTGIAEARSEKTLAYQREPSFQAAVRVLRIDAGLKLVEKDADAGYVIFEYTEDKKTFRGSLEVIDVVKDGRKLTRFVVTIEDRPSYVEIEMLTKLERKLRAELGAPAPAPSAPPKKDEPPSEKAPPAEKPKDDGPPVSDKP